MNPKIYRWVICAAGTLALFCTGGLLVTGFNVYTPYLISEGGLTNQEVSVVLMVRNVFSLLSMFLVVPMIRRLDIRLNITTAVLAGALAFAVFSFARHFALFCLGTALAGLSYGLGGMVSVSVVVKRWFDDHEGLALGICAAGTGLSAVIGSPIITAMVESRSMQYSMRMEAAFMALTAALLFVLMRNYPSEEKHAAVLRERQAKTAGHRHYNPFALSRAEKLLLYLGVLLCGMSYTVSPFLTVLFREKGFDAATVGWLVSFMGLALCVGKCVYGGAVDLLGRVRAGNVFHGCFVLAIFLCAACVPGSRVMAFAAMTLLGVGFPMLSVGLSQLAAGTAHPEYYADGVRQLQTAYMLGTVVFSTVPGILADRMGTYIPCYYLLAVVALAAALIQQGLLMKTANNGGNRQ